MTDTTYNGWTNYETWCVGMYLDGNYTGEGTYRYTIDIVENAMWEGGPNHLRSHVADTLKAFIEEETDTYTSEVVGAPDPINPLTTDLLGASLSRVNWYELAEAWIENMSELVES